MTKGMEHITVSFGVPAYWESPTTEIAKVLRKIADDFEQNGIPQQAIYDHGTGGGYIGEVKIDAGWTDE